MDLVINSNGQSTRIYLDGKEVSGARIVIFSAEVGRTAICIYEQIVRDTEGRVVLDNGDIKTEIKGVKF